MPTLRSLLLTITLAILAQLAAGCSGSGSSAPPSAPRPASLQFQRADVGGAVSSARVAALLATRAPVSATPAMDIAVPATVAYNVGAIDSTTTYFFMLRNTGGLPAFGVTITADDPAVVISPSTIGMLEPDGLSALTPIIKVTVTHGVQPSGIGMADLLPPGLFIAGMTASASSGVFTQTTIGGVVRIADVQLENCYMHNETRETEVGTGQILFWRELVRPRDQVSATSADGIWGPRVRNTGNSPLFIDIYDWTDDGFGGQFPFDRTLVLQPGEYYDPLPDGYVPWLNLYLRLFHVRTGGVQSVDRLGDRAYQAFHPTITVAN